MTKRKDSFYVDVRFYFDRNSPESMALHDFLMSETRRLHERAPVGYLSRLLAAAMLGRQGDMSLAGLFLPPERLVASQGGGPVLPPAAVRHPPLLPSSSEGNADVVDDDLDEVFGE